MKTAASWLSKRPWLLSLIIVTVVVVPGYIRGEQIDAKTDRTVACVQEWADQVTERTQALSELANARTNALDELLRVVYFSPGDEGLAFQRLAEYVRVSNEYRQAVQKSPVPPSPQLSC